MVIYMVTSRVMSAAEFKAKCLEVLDQVAESGHGVVVTKRGRPVAQLVPIVNKPKRLVGAMKGEIAITGDIISPIASGWGATEK
jgi:prevent-host-death family protein